MKVRIAGVLAFHITRAGAPVVLVAKPSLKPSKQWSFFGGDAILGHDASPFHTAYRELHEETYGLVQPLHDVHHTLQRAKQLCFPVFLPAQHILSLALPVHYVASASLGDAAAAHTAAYTALPGHEQPAYEFYPEMSQFSWVEWARVSQGDPRLAFTHSAVVKKGGRRLDAFIRAHPPCEIAGCPCS